MPRHLLLLFHSGLVSLPNDRNCQVVWLRFQAGSDLEQNDDGEGKQEEEGSRLWTSMVSFGRQSRLKGTNSSTPQKWYDQTKTDGFCKQKEDGIVCVLFRINNTREHRCLEWTKRYFGINSPRLLPFPYFTFLLLVENLENRETDKFMRHSFAKRDMFSSASRLACSKFTGSQTKTKRKKTRCQCSRFCLSREFIALLK